MTNKQIPKVEKEVYDNLQKIYLQLSDLKNNRSKYINSKQVYSIYDDFLSLLHDLSITRKDEELKGMTLQLPNASDTIIDDIWQLLSLCFVTCGLIKFAPATYSSLSTVNKLLEHLKECQVYTVDDLKPIESRLDEIRVIIASSEDQAVDDDVPEFNDGNAFPVADNAQRHINHKREELLLLRKKLNKCQQLLNELKSGFSQVPQDLESVYNELITIRKSLLNYLTNSPPKKDDKAWLSLKVSELKKQLRAIEAKRDDDGKFRSLVATPEQLHATQMVLNGLLDDCNNFINDVSIQQDTLDISSLFKLLELDDDDNVLHLRLLYSKLIDLKLTLDNLLVTRRWTMRETDLYNYQKSLKSIDDDRIALNSKIAEASLSPKKLKNIKKFQVVILYLLRRCYSLIYKLLELSEPVSESLQPIHNQLSTVRRCLLEIKRVDGLNNLRELYPFQFKLASLDNLRSDGKFIINNQIPEGQGTLNALLAECFDIMHELKIELEEKEDDDADDDDDTKTNNITDDEDIKSDDEVELKRNRYVGFNEADYDQESESDFDVDLNPSASEYEDNDYY